MHKIVKDILESNTLTAVKRCLDIDRKSKDISRVFASLQAKVQEAKDAHASLGETIIREPHKLDFSESIAAIATFHAADEFGLQLSRQQNSALEQLQKDPQSVDDMEAALREIIERLETVFSDAQKAEKKHAQSLGIEYGGNSPTLSSLTSVKQEYTNALQAIENGRDSSNANWFQRYIQLLTP